MVVVRMVRVRNMSVSETADIQGRCPNWVRNLLRRYDEGDLEGLRDLLRSGRPPKIPLREMDKIMKHASQTPTTPAALHQQVFQKTKVKLHIAHVRD